MLDAEVGGDDARRLGQLALHDRKIFVAGEVDDQLRAVGAEVGGERPGNLGAPIIDQPVGLGRPARAHFEPVGADRVERAERAVEPGKDAQMVLREGERVGVGAGGVEAAIDVAGEGADRGALLGPGEGLEALVIEIGEACPKCASARRDWPGPAWPRRGRGGWRRSRSAAWSARRRTGVSKSSVLAGERRISMARRASRCTARGQSAGISIAAFRIFAEYFRGLARCPETGRLTFGPRQRPRRAHRWADCLVWDAFGLHFDDRLKTLLAAPVADPRDRAVRWRQLVDLLARRERAGGRGGERGARPGPARGVRDRRGGARRDAARDRRAPPAQDLLADPRRPADADRRARVRRADAERRRCRA